MISKRLYLSNLAWKNKDLFSVLKIIKKNGFDGIIVKDYEINSWVNTLSKILCDSNIIKKIKRNLKKSYNPISWEQVFKTFFLKNWNTIINKND